MQWLKEQNGREYKPADESKASTQGIIDRIERPDNDGETLAERIGSAPALDEFEQGVADEMALRTQVGEADAEADKILKTYDGNLKRALARAEKLATKAKGTEQYPRFRAIQNALLARRSMSAGSRSRVKSRADRKARKAAAK
jgi:hypothetical protein